MPAHFLLADPFANARQCPGAGALSAREVAVRPRESPQRCTIVRSALGTVDMVRYPAAWSETGCEARPRLIMPLTGLVRYTYGGIETWLDSHKALLTPPGEFGVAHPVTGLGHVGLTITLEPFVYDQVFGRAEAHSRPTTAALRLLANRIARSDCDRSDGKLLMMLRIVAACSTVPPMRKTSTIARIKEMLHRHDDEMLSLDRLARAIGVCPAYLTQEFTRCEGTPLYRYQKQLRLARALQELPECPDITALALELGFSNHSHFTAAFRQEFGLTPSAYRAEFA